jgi:hypothetical protein
MEPPPRALLIIGDGLLVADRARGAAAATGRPTTTATTSLDAARPVPHLDALAGSGGSGLLVLTERRRLRGGGDALSSGSANVLAQLLGVAEVSLGADGRWVRAGG